MNIKWIRVASIRFALRSSLSALRSSLSPPSPLPPLSLVLINISQFKVLRQGRLGYPFDRPPRFNLKFLKLQSFPPIYIYVLNYSPIIIFPKIDEQTTKFIINFLLYILIIEKKKRKIIESLEPVSSSRRKIHRSLLWLFHVLNYWKNKKGEESTIERLILLLSSSSFHRSIQFYQKKE